MENLETSNKKNIGILLPSMKNGGVFQYALAIINSLTSFSNDFDYCVFHYNTENPQEFIKNSKNIQFMCLDDAGNSFLSKIKLLLNILLAKPIFTTNKKNKDLFEKSKIDLFISPIPFFLAFENRIPFIVSVLDMMHKYYPKFPEYSFFQRLKKDLIFKFSAKHSVLTIVDSKESREDLYKFYNIAKEKVKIIPFLPSEYVFQYKDMNQESAGKLLDKYDLPPEFIFYPAQFWVHKNHIRLIKALRLLKQEKNVNIPLVLVGNPKANEDNYQKVMDLAQGLDVKCLGYVSNEEVVALYKKTIALVFTSVGGPTNIPLLEALILNTPILCPNLFAMPEQVGEAGVLFNPFDIKDMAEKIYQVWTNKELRKQLVEKGKEKAQSINLENYSQYWEKAIKEAINNGKH